MIHRPSRALRTVVSALLLLGLSASTLAGVGAAPTMIRIGNGTAAEEPLWLMNTPAGVTPNKGKVYDLTFSTFGGANDRMKAFEAGAVDCATGTPGTLMEAAGGGVPLVAVASISRETYHSTQLTGFYVMDNSGIKSVKDLKGKNVGITGIHAGTEIWIRAALHHDGLDPDRDVRFVVVGFPQQGAALRAGQIDLAMLPEPFLTPQLKQGGIRELFNSKYAMPWDEDLQTLFCNPTFVKNNPVAMRAFLSDYVASMKFYLSHMDEARTALVQSHMVQIDLASYLKSPDYDRNPSGRLSVENWAKTEDAMISGGFMEASARVDPSKIVDQSYLPK